MYRPSHPSAGTYLITSVERLTSDSIRVNFDLPPGVSFSGLDVGDWEADVEGGGVTNPIGGDAVESHVDLGFDVNVDTEVRLTASTGVATDPAHVVPSPQSAPIPP